MNSQQQPRNSISRAAEIHLVIAIVEDEKRISDTKDAGQIRTDPRGHAADTGKAKRRVSNLRKDTVNGSLGN